jgi:hypothetical protein
MVVLSRRVVAGLELIINRRGVVAWESWAHLKVRLVIIIGLRLIEWFFLAERRKHTLIVLLIEIILVYLWVWLVCNVHDFSTVGITSSFRYSNVKRLSVCHNFGSNWFRFYSLCTFILRRDLLIERGDVIFILCRHWGHSFYWTLFNIISPDWRKFILSFN